MFSVTCDKCGSGMQLDASVIPPSGMVKKCPKCGHNVTVMPQSPGGIGQELDLDGFMPMSAPRGGAKPQATPPPLPAARGPAVAAFDQGLDPNDVVDLPAPKGPTPSLDVPDLLAPVGPSRTRDIADLPVPVGPSPTRGLGGAGVDDSIDLLAPVGPSPTRGAAVDDGIDLLAPVGPSSTKNAPDLLAPVGPKPTKGAMDLLTPVGPTPTKGSMDLLTPVGPTPTKGAAPDLPAPKGFFDDIPQPKGLADDGGSPFGELDLSPVTSGAARPGASRTGVSSAPPLAARSGVSSAPPLVPPLPAPRTGASMPPPLLPTLPQASPPPGSSGPPRTTAAVPALDLDEPPQPAGPAGGFSLDGLDLVPGGEGGKSGPSAPMIEPPQPFDSGNAGTADASVISFKAPGPGGGGPAPPLAPTRAPAGGGKGSGGLLDLDDGGPPIKKGGTVLGDDAKAKAATKPNKGRGQKAAKQPLTPEQRRRRALIGGGALLVLALAGAGLFVKDKLDRAKALKAEVERTLTEARSHLASDELDHWNKAFDAAERALAKDGKNADALGLAAQAQFAAAVDEGTNLDARRTSGDDVLNRAVQAALDSAEIEKAKALRLVLDQKGSEAKAMLVALRNKGSSDSDLQLFLGWAALAGGDAALAKTSFEQTLAAQRDRVPALYGLGQAQLKLGDSAAAKATFEKLLAKRTNHVGAWVNLARMLPRDREGTREKRFMEIVKSEHAAKAHPSDVSLAWALAGDEALRGRRFDEAAERFKRAEELDADNIEAVLGRGFSLLAQGNLGESAKMFQDVARRQPDNFRARLGLARVALAQGKLELAKETIGKALAKNADDPDVQLWYGEILEADPTGTSNENAAAAYKRAMELDPSNYEPVVALSQLYQNKMQKPAEAAQVLATLAKDAEQDAFLANTLGQSYLAAGDAAKAEAWFRTALGLEAQNADARANLGAALEAQGNLAGAIVELENARRAAPENEPIALKLGAAYVRAKRYGEAEKVYVALLDDSSGKKPTVPARAAAGRFYARRGDVAKAKALGEMIATEEPKNPAGLYLRGVALFADGNLSDAQKAVLEAVAIDPQAQYYDLLGRIFERLNQLEDAVAAYGNAITRDRTFVEPLLGRARIYQLRREWDRAEPDLEAAMVLEPERAEPWLRVGDGRYAVGKKKEAIAPYQEALRRDSRLAEAYFKLGRIYYDMDRPGETVSNLRQSVQLAKPDADWLPDAVLMLGYTLQASGKRGEMCQAFQKYMQIASPTAAARGDVKQILLGCP
jgi:tetratricopeptide (TPR) repeat protein